MIYACAGVSRSSFDIKMFVREFDDVRKCFVTTPLNIFFLLGFLSRTFTIYRTVGEGEVIAVTPF